MGPVGPARHSRTTATGSTSRASRARKPVCSGREEEACRASCVGATGMSRHRLRRDSHVHNLFAALLFREKRLYTNKSRLGQCLTIIAMLKTAKHKLDNYLLSIIRTFKHHCWHSTHHTELEALFLQHTITSLKVHHDHHWHKCILSETNTCILIWWNANWRSFRFLHVTKHNCKYERS